MPNRLLFPERSRDFPGKRWINICLRTLHLIGVAGAGYAFLSVVDNAVWENYLRLTILSGVSLTLISIWSNGIFLLQLRGQAILLKILLLALILVLPDFKSQLFLSVLIISGLISHAPGDIRYFSIFHGKRIESI